MTYMVGNYRISLDLSGLYGFSHVLSETLGIQLSKAVQQVAVDVQRNWQETVHRSGGKGGISAYERDAYAASIQVKPTAMYSALVWSDYTPAEQIETGRPSRDLKLMLNTSNKTRQFKSGKKYLIIPFRHNTPGNDGHAAPMPPAIHKLAGADGFATSKIIGHGKRLSASGNMVRQRKFLWSSRLPAGLAPKLQPSHKTDPYAGMVRMNTKSGESKRRSSSYLTFRVMVEGSSGWIIPARPGLFIVQGVIAQMQPEAEKKFAESINVSLQAIKASLAA